MGTLLTSLQAVSTTIIAIATAVVTAVTTAGNELLLIPVGLGLLGSGVHFVKKFL